MGFSDLTLKMPIQSKLAPRVMPFMAMLRHDCRALCASWLVRAWLIGSAVLTLLIASSNWTASTTPILVSAILFPYLVLPWPLVVMILSVSPVSGARAEMIADGFLSRPITRYEYVLATFVARAAVVLAIYLVVVVPATAISALARRPVMEEPIGFYGAACAIGVVGLVQIFLVAMGFFLGTITRSQWLALAVLLVLWFPVNLILNTFALEEFSPISLSRAMPELLRQTWSAAEKEPDETRVDLSELARGASSLLSLFGGPEAGGEAREPAQEKGYFETDEFRDTRVGRIVAGYGIPTVIAVLLATVAFCLRDL